MESCFFSLQIMVFNPKSNNLLEKIKNLIFKNIEGVMDPDGSYSDLEILSCCALRLRTSLRRCYQWSGLQHMGFTIPR